MQYSTRALSLEFIARVQCYDAASECVKVHCTEAGCMHHVCKGLCVWKLPDALHEVAVARLITSDDSVDA